MIGLRGSGAVLDYLNVKVKPRIHRFNLIRLFKHALCCAATAWFEFVKMYFKNCVMLILYCCQLRTTRPFYVFFLFGGTFFEGSNSLLC